MDQNKLNNSQPGSPQEEPQLEKIKTSKRSWRERWENIVRLGMGEIFLRVGTSIASIALVLIVVWVMGRFYLQGNNNDTIIQADAAAVQPTATQAAALPPFELPDPQNETTSLTRYTELNTTLPDRPRYEITQYIVQPGDTVIGIGEKFNLDPKSILWGNFTVLADDPHRLNPDQVLNILPQDGLLHVWNAGDGLNAVSEYFKVTPEDIINWPGNGLDPETIGDYANPNIEDGKVLFIPGGVREFISWTGQQIPRSNPAVAKVQGPGWCGVITTGAVGNATFVWPSTSQYISGYDYSPSTNHYAIDIGGSLGNAIYAADSGVVVYSGWNDWGYGYVVVIDHGNGWQTLYAHLSTIYSGCGASVFQGDTIGLMGSTGNSSGPHLHFEMQSTQYGRVNPHLFLQK
jgi:murein DD-endopeptidase MepM/ murein hydrolase activator NlpD